MKNLRFTLFAVVLFVVTVANAQVSFGVQGGINLSTISDRDAEPKVGFNIGVLTDIDLTHNMGIRSGVFFTTKGMREVKSLICGETGTIRYTTNLMYLQLPVHIAYRIDVSPGTRVVFHAGPYIAYGVDGTIRRNGGDRTDAFGCRTTQFQPFDWGLGIGVGVEFNRILVGIGWDFGLFEISNRSGERARNQNAFLSVGYRF
jgi:hypothetical protein